MKKMKNLALVAHDANKNELVQFVTVHKKTLKKYQLLGTKSTALLLTQKTGLKIKAMLSGPMGGDLQIGAMVATEKLDLLIFFRDPLTAQPHDPDINALVRICDVHNIPIATNPASAALILKGL